MLPWASNFSYLLFKIKETCDGHWDTCLRIPSKDPPDESADGLQLSAPLGTASAYRQTRCPRRCLSQGCPHPKAGCGRNKKAQHFDPLPHYLTIGQSWWAKHQSYVRLCWAWLQLIDFFCSNLLPPSSSIGIDIPKITCLSTQRTCCPIQPKYPRALYRVCWLSQEWSHL